MHKITRHTGTLPNGFVLWSVKADSAYPVTGGGVADIYTGTHNGKKVAIKVLRLLVMDEEPNKVKQVWPQ
jgi:hypothetical protein